MMCSVMLEYIYFITFALLCSAICYNLSVNQTVNELVTYYLAVDFNKYNDLELSHWRYHQAVGKSRSR